MRYGKSVPEILRDRLPADYPEGGGSRLMDTVGECWLVVSDSEYEPMAKINFYILITGQEYLSGWFV